MVRLCEKCKTREATSRQAKFCAQCRQENQSENGRRGGKRNAAAGHGRIHVTGRDEE